MNRGSGSFAPQHCLNKVLLYLSTAGLFTVGCPKVFPNLDAITMEVIQNGARMYYTVAKHRL